MLALVLVFSPTESQINGSQGNYSNNDVVEVISGGESEEALWNN